LGDVVLVVVGKAVIIYLRIVGGGEEAVEGEHFRCGHSHASVFCSDLMMVFFRRGRRRQRQRRIITGFLKCQLFALFVDAQKVGSRRVARHSQHHSHLRFIDIIQKEKLDVMLAKQLNNIDYIYVS
jgi:hypothetical protein